LLNLSFSLVPQITGSVPGHKASTDSNKMTQ
jgi:hypothetical protein